MANNRLSMRKITEALRLHFGHDRTNREIALVVGTSPTTVGEYLRRARVAVGIVVGLLHLEAETVEAFVGRDVRWVRPVGGGVRELVAHLAPTRVPFVIGLAGSVAAGKSTAAAQLAAHWRADGRKVDVVSTDGFLLPNAALEALGLLQRKGFPESYDAPALHAFLDAVRSGAPARVPLYSHQIYDVLPGAGKTITKPEIVIVEGINALQPVFTEGRLDARVYIHAQEEDLFRWYQERLVELRDAARSDPSSYFVRFLPLTQEDWQARVKTIWEAVNLPNLHEHIAPSMAHANWVWEKGPDHTRRALYPPGNPDAATSLG